MQIRVDPDPQHWLKSRQSTPMLTEGAVEVTGALTKFYTNHDVGQQHILSMVLNWGI